MLFGVSATDGPLQVALLLSAAFASLVAFKNGYTVASVAEAAVGGVTVAMGAVFILLAVGALIGTWNMAGTIPTVVDYGIRLVSPTWFYVTAAAVCAVVGMVTGSSWTTAGTLGVAFVGMSNVLGPRRGDRRRRGHLRGLLRRQDDPAVGDHDPGAPAGRRRPHRRSARAQHVLDGGTGARRSASWSFFFLGRAADPDAEVSTDEAREALASAFNISALNLLPLLLLVVFAVLRMPPFLSILGSAVFAAVLAPFLQWDAVVAFVDDPSLGQGRDRASKAGYAAMATGFVSNSGVPQIDDLFSRGGMASMLTTIWLVLGALSFAAVMEHAGFLQRLLEPIVSRTRRRGSLIAAVNASGIGLNVIAGDQYVADVLPARMFRKEFARRGLAPQVLSRAVEDSGTVTSVLVPWNTCGAYISGVLGVSTAAYFPFCFFNLLSPLLDVLYGYIGFKVPQAETPWEDEADDRHAAGRHRRRDPWLTRARRRPVEPNDGASGSPRRTPSCSR